MRKTSVYLSEGELARLAALAKREAVSQAEVIRRAIQRYVPVPFQDRVFGMDGCSEGPGGSVADVDERDLLRGFGS